MSNWRARRGGTPILHPPLSVLRSPHPQPENAPSEAGAGSLAPMKLTPGTFVVLDPDYHRRQVVMLLRLARTTRDPQTPVCLPRFRSMVRPFHDCAIQNSSTKFQQIYPLV